MEFRPIASSSAGNAYLVSSAGRTILIDCGVRFAQLQQECGHSVASLDACLLTHAHTDHSRAAPEVARAAVDIYTNKQTARDLALGHRCVVMEPLKTYEIAGFWRVAAFKAVHDVEAFGFVVADPHGDKLLFLTDSAYCKHRFEGLTHIAVECNHSGERLLEAAVSEPGRAMGYARAARNHMSVERLVEMLKANDLAKVQEIHLLHMSDGNADEDQFRRQVQEATGCPVYVAAKQTLAAPF